MGGGKGGVISLQSLHTPHHIRSAAVCTYIQYMSQSHNVQLLAMLLILVSSYFFSYLVMHRFCDEVPLSKCMARYVYSTSYKWKWWLAHLLVVEEGVGYLLEVFPLLLHHLLTHPRLSSPSVSTSSISYSSYCCCRLAIHTVRGASIRNRLGVTSRRARGSRCAMSLVYTDILPGQKSRRPSLLLT